MKFSLLFILALVFLVSYLSRLCLAQGSEDYFYIFFYESYIYLAFIFRIMVHFELILYVV